MTKSLIALCLAACGATAYFSPDVALPYIQEAVDLARAAGDRSILSDVRSYQAFASHAAGQPTASQAAAEEGRDVAESPRRRVHITALPNLVGHRLGVPR